ncbi:glycosyltransferase [Clostridium formicaceticum]|uniref:Glycosyltransferase n=1 Tax=Clostridium formicaceticum TaxID=1497 RepID=A0AAC9RL01_9CLOT|nr:glycosyltransferase [Clostridium formicaceticum]AOY77083.1 glycosyltransferase [Clostridium formicaceticum]ARE87592.1 Phospho-N-acetylmuramoyl-pentapeptide-transferase [Clostridium formicaceticum]
MIVSIIVMIVSIFVTRITMPYMMRMLMKANVVGKNYKGDTIPIGMGITFIPVMLCNFFLMILLLKDLQEVIFIFLTGITTMGFAGIIDDLIGNKSASGFKGHFSRFFKGELTTGMLKAGVGGVIAFMISWIYSVGIIEFFINAFVIALFTNLLNLLDLRPGRALKTYLFIAVIFLVIGIAGITKMILFSIIGYCIGYLPQDLKARSMMGDVGSNTLGITLGIITIISFSIKVKVVLLILLLLVHTISEKYSLSKVIKSNYILNYLDELGRS